MDWVIAFLISAAASFILCFPVRRFLVHWNVIDRPNERSSHFRPTVRGGGIVIVLVLLVAAGIGGTLHGQTEVLATLLAAATVLA